MFDFELPVSLNTSPDPPAFTGSWPADSLEISRITGGVQPSHTDQHSTDDELVESAPELSTDQTGYVPMDDILDDTDVDSEDHELSYGVPYLLENELLIRALLTRELLIRELLIRRVRHTYASSTLTYIYYANDISVNFGRAL
jgi:hypothetical protein